MITNTITRFIYRVYSFSNNVELPYMLGTVLIYLCLLWQWCTGPVLNLPCDGNGWLEAGQSNGPLSFAGWANPQDTNSLNSGSRCSLLFAIRVKSRLCQKLLGKDPEAPCIMCHGPWRAWKILVLSKVLKTAAVTMYAQRISDPVFDYHLIFWTVNT